MQRKEYNRFFNGMVMDVPDSIIQQFQNSSVPIFDENKDSIYRDVAFNRCLQLGEFCDAVVVEIDKGSLYRPTEKANWCWIIPFADTFQVSFSVLTPRGKVFLQKRTY